MAAGPTATPQIHSWRPASEPLIYCSETQQRKKVNIFSYLSIVPSSPFYLTINLQ